jgi:prostaglandin-E synthase 1
MPMMSVDAQALRIYAVCVVALVLKMALVGVRTGAVRTRQRVTLNPEDAKQFKSKLVETDPPDVARAKRCHLNDLENIPAFWILGLVYLAFGASATGMLAYGATFTVARFLHTLFYLRGMQPYRSIVFTVGTLSLLGLCVNILARAF